VKAGNKWRMSNEMVGFNLGAYFKSVKAKEFIKEVEGKYGASIISGRGRNSHTWVHPLVFIDIALDINPKLKLEVYEWIFDQLIRFRNDSGDSYRQMSAAIFSRYQNVREFQKYISGIAICIKNNIGVKDWEHATECQLKRRDKIHSSIVTLSNVMQDTDAIVRLAIEINK
jgi:hypothetical protein